MRVVCVCVYVWGWGSGKSNWSHSSQADPACKENRCQLQKRQWLHVSPDGRKITFSLSRCWKNSTAIIFYLLRLGMSAVMCQAEMHVYTLTSDAASNPGVINQINNANKHDDVWFKVFLLPLSLSKPFLAPEVFVPTVLQHTVQYLKHTPSVSTGIYAQRSMGFNGVLVQWSLGRLKLLSTTLLSINSEARVQDKFI